MEGEEYIIPFDGHAILQSLFCLLEEVGVKFSLECLEALFLQTIHKLVLILTRISDLEAIFFFGREDSMASRCFKMQAVGVGDDIFTVGLFMTWS